MVRKKLKQRVSLPLLISATDATSVRNITYKDKKIKKSTELFGGDDGAPIKEVGHQGGGKK